LFSAEIPSGQYLRFDRLTTENGLSNNLVFDIDQDDYGFMWFATADGLNRYDGDDFKIHRHNPDDPNSLSQNYLWALTVAKDGTLWIGTDDAGRKRLPGYEGY